MPHRTTIEIMGEDCKFCKAGQPFTVNIPSGDLEGRKTIYYLIDHVEQIEGGCRLTLRKAGE